MFSPTLFHRLWNVPVEPVKWMPARFLSAQQILPMSEPWPGRKLTTPAGSPASS